MGLNRLPSKTGKREIEIKTLLIDGNALLKVSYHGAKNEFNNNGEHIGGIYQFLTVLRKFLDEDNFDRVFVFWDGKFSGKLRYDFYPEYKANRNKNYETGTIPQDKDLLRQKNKIWNYLEQLLVRQYQDQYVESDDLIAHYCLEKGLTEKITIASGDRDYCQLVSDNISLYLLDLKKYVTSANYNDFFQHKQENSALIKTIAGDTSDNIKGVKGVKEDTLLKHFPELKERKVTLNEIITHSKEILEERKSNKLKPLMALENIVNGTTDGCQGDKLYEINEKLVNLKKPLLTQYTKNIMEDLMNLPVNPEGRDIKIVYKRFKEDGLDRMISEARFPTFMLPFKKIINKETDFYNKVMEDFDENN